MRTLGVVGAGAMGAGIAQIGVTAGLDVLLFDLDRNAADGAVGDIAGRLRRLVEKGQLSQDEADAAIGRLKVAGPIGDVAPADIVIEAIVERLEPKQTLFGQLEEIVTSDAILATNTSSLSVAAIGARCRHPERVCGLHFFNPVPVMKLVEVISAPGTSASVAATATALVERLGKIPVQVRDGPGFLVNLAGRAYVTEALHIVEEGVADVATVDRIMRDGAGFRMGPFELMDLTGIDVNLPATRSIHQGFQFDPRLKTTPLHELMLNSGRFGRKTGRGFHDYTGTRVLESDPALVAERQGVLQARVIGDGDWDALRAVGLGEGGDLNLIAPVGEDVAGVCHRLGLNPARTVAIDFTGLDRRHLTVMAAIGGAAAAQKVACWLRGHSFRVEIVRDSLGFVLQRVLAMVANLGCELAQTSVGSPGDIDWAMRLAQNYPLGPLEWAERLGVGTTLAILRGLQEATGTDRYRPSLWLRRRALLGLPIHTPD